MTAADGEDSGGWLAAAARAVAARPTLAGAAVIAIHALAWTLFSSIAYRNPGLDPLEGLAYGSGWQLGYWKHPPLPWWELAAVRSLAGSVIWPYILLAQAHVALALFAAWRLGCDLLGPLRGLAALLLLEGIRFFGTSATTFNHDVALLPFWALAGWLGWRALRDGRSRDWVLLGCMLGGGVYAKYTIALLAVAIVAFLIGDPAARRVWRTRGPWLAAAAALLVAAPHVAWLATHDFLPFAYASERASVAASAYERIRGPIGFAMSHVLTLLPAAALFAVLDWPSQRSTAAPAVTGAALRYLATIAFAPFLLMVAGAVAAGRELHAGWGFTFWCFIGVFAFAVRPPTIRMRRLGLLLGAWAALLVMLAAGNGVWNWLNGGAMTGRPAAVAFAGDQFAALVTDRWRAATGQPLAYVIGTQWPASNVGFFSADRPTVVAVSDLRLLPWIDAADLRRRGAVVVWEEAFGPDGPPGSIATLARGAAPSSRIEIAWQALGRVGTDRFRVAILPPAP